MTLTFDPKINEFSGLTVKHLYVKFGDRRRVVFLDIFAENRQTNNGKKLITCAVKRSRAIEIRLDFKRPRTDNQAC